MTTLRPLPALLAVVLLVGCGAAAAPTPVPTPEPTPTAVPGPGGVGGGGSGSGSGNGGGAPPPGGIVDPGGGVDLGNATFVTPMAGLIDQHPVSVELVRAGADAGGVTAELRWWSGVAPCNALDSVQVDKDESAKTIRLTVIEGSGRGDMACIDLAQLKATVVDLGVLAAGSWTISAEGGAPAISLEVA